MKNNESEEIKKLEKLEELEKSSQASFIDDGNQYESDSISKVLSELCDLDIKELCEHPYIKEKVENERQRE